MRLETALLDAFGRHFGRSVADAVRILGLDEGILNARPSAVRYSGAITAESARKERVSAWKMRIYGFHQVKIKVGVAGQDDPARLKTLRRSSAERWISESTPTRHGASRNWSSASGLFCRFDPPRLEQPTPHEEVAALARIRPTLGVPIMLDESLCGLPNARRAIELRTADIFNVRLSKCGGIVPSLAIMGLAKRAGLNVQLGCHPGETGLLSAAGRHVACQMEKLRYLEGSYDRHVLAENVTIENPTFRFGGRAADRRAGIRRQCEHQSPRKHDDRSRGGRFWRLRTFGIPSGRSTRLSRLPTAIRFTWRLGRSKRTRSRGRAVVLHGVQSHGGWYRNLGKTLAEASFEAIFPDRRGSGANERDRGDAKSAGRLIQDVVELLERLKRESSAPIALAGISWGGKIAVATAAKRPDLVERLGAALSRPDPAVNVSRRERLQIVLALFTQPRKRFKIPLTDPALFTASPAGQAFISGDPLGIRDATARLLAASFFLDRAVRRAPKHVKQPTLLMLAGQDRIVNNDLTLQYFERLASDRRQVILYPEAHHTLEFEPDPSIHARDLAAWFDQTFQSIKK